MQKEVDANKVISNLSEKISSLILQNAILQIQLEELKKSNSKNKQEA